MPRVGCTQSSSRLALVLAPALLIATLGCREDAESPAGPESSPALVTAAVAGALALRQVSAGQQHTCAVTTDNLAYCWGKNEGGRLGDGTTTERPAPVPVVGGLRFLEVSAGVYHTCGVTTSHVAYCWGSSPSGAVILPSSPTPVEVPGGRRFRSVSVGENYFCAVTPSDRAFCWGVNNSGRLGIGSVPGSATPVRVLGGLRFRRVSTGFSHACGTTTDNKAYCWGDNQNFQLGDGTATSRAKPAAVLGGLKFREVHVGSGFKARPSVESDYGSSCGVTTDNRAYCWGVAPGIGGTGSSTPELIPGRRFRSVTPGSSHACAVTPANVAFCWGDGPIGTGEGANYQLARVAGGLEFSTLSASGTGGHTCGVTTANRAYCWGRNSSGELGDGTDVDHPTPVAVVGPI